MPRFVTSTSAARQCIVVAGLIAAVLGPVQAQQPPTPAQPADVLLEAALEEARAGNKTVFVDFGASWCGPCRALDGFMNAPEVAPLIAEHFVILKLTDWERGPLAVRNNPGAGKLANGWGATGSIPFYVTVDAAGRKIASGGGYPGGRRGIERFMALLRESAPRLSTEAASTLAASLVSRSDGLATLEGRVTDPRGEAVGRATVSIVGRAFIEGQWKPAVVGRTSTDEAGHYSVDVMAGSLVVAVEPAKNNRATPALAPVTFHPASTTTSGATTVELEAGEGRLGVNVTLASAAPSPVTGSVVSSGGQPLAGAAVVLTNVDWPTLIVSGTTDASATFTLQAVPRGRYALWVHGQAGVGTSRSIEVTFQDLDLTGPSSPVRVVTRPVASVTGRVRFEGAEPAAADRDAIRVTAVATSPRPGMPTVLPQSRLDPSGAFELATVFGERVIRVQDLPPGWMLKSVTRDGVDITDTPWDPMQAAGGTIDVTVTSRVGTIAGTRLDDAGTPVRGGVAIAFARNAAKWSYPTRFVRRAPVQDDGTFEMGSLPAGDYLVALLATAPRNWDAPESLEALRSSATAVSVGEGERKQLTLRAVAGG